MLGNRTKLQGGWVQPLGGARLFRAFRRVLVLPPSLFDQGKVEGRLGSKWKRGVERGGVRPSKEKKGWAGQMGKWRKRESG